MEDSLLTDVALCLSPYYVAPKSQISMSAKMLADEYGTASNIKSRVNRLSVLSAITSTQQRLKLYNRGKEQEQAYEREAMAIDS
jgi:peptide subunit release factor 1 (eRF1)